MSAAPVHAIARRTRGEPVLSEIDVRRHSFENKLFIDVLKWRVALEAARKNTEVSEIECAQDLTNLFYVVFTFNEQALAIAATAGDPGVTSQDNSILRLCDAYDFVIDDLV
jgi:hypothetical protein